MDTTRMKVVNNWVKPGNLTFLIRWMAIGSVVGVFGGIASAIFLIGLEQVTYAQTAHPWLLFALPAGGALVSWIYMKFGGVASKGNNLLLECIHGGNEKVPLRMAPLILLGTWVTHLFGGSAGREGTAVQMGGTLAEMTASIFKVHEADRKIVLMCGISAGFGSVFGTPMAAAIFALEVLTVGLLRHRALLPCLTASIVGHLVTEQLLQYVNISHAHLVIEGVPTLSVILLLKLVAIGILFGLASQLFCRMICGIKKLSTTYIPHPVWRSVAGGFVVVGMTLLLGTRDYNGLSLPLLVQSFDGQIASLSFLWKTLFTAVTLGTGFQGGEVTPLFIVGATLGHALAGWFQLAPPFLAALGFVAVFSGAAKTPVACLIMGIEMFGSDAALYLFLTCVISYLFSGQVGIYSSQRTVLSKQEEGEHFAHREREQ